MNGGSSIYSRIVPVTLAVNTVKVLGLWIILENLTFDDHPKKPKTSIWERA